MTAQPRTPPRSSALSKSWARRYAVRVLAVNAMWPLVLLATVPSALTTHTWSDWWWSAAVCVLFAGLYVLFGLPSKAMLFGWVRPLFAVGAIVVVGSAAVRSTTLHGSLGAGSLIVPLALGGALVALRAVDARRRLQDGSSPLRWPLPGGRWTVVEGTGTLPNHHWSVVAQRGALDLVGAVRGGRSTGKLIPRDCRDFAAYGHEVVAPCDGYVRVAQDGHPDRPARGSPPPGNHVVIDTETGETLTLAHLQPGSVTVAAGQLVTRGEPIGRVGNSGNSSEPHLHIHAVRAGRPLRPRFDSVHSSLRRNAVVTAR